jgi:hypothetical protein
MRVVFFNFFHNGDLHVSRSFVKAIAEKYNCEYVHSCSSDLLSDLNVKYSSNLYNLKQNTPSYIDNNIYFINTWYSGNRELFLNFGVTFDTLYQSFSKLNILDLSNPKDFFPSIDFEKFYINKAKEWIGQQRNKKVFISNGNVLSGQSENFDFSPIINHLCSNNPNITFIISNKEQGINKYNNLFYSQDIIQKSGNDLNENAYLSTFCDVIVGRYSGAYTFAMNKDNYFDKSKKFLAFVNPSIDAVWVNMFKPDAEVIKHTRFDKDYVIGSIQEML